MDCLKIYSKRIYSLVFNRFINNHAPGRSNENQLNIGCLSLHEVEKFFIGLGGFQLIQHKLDGLCFVHRVQ